MRSESGDFTIYLVLFDDETKSLAMLRAKELIDEKYLAFGDDGQVDGVLPVDKCWISLCKVNRPDKIKIFGCRDWQTPSVEHWLLRLLMKLKRKYSTTAL